MRTATAALLLVLSPCAIAQQRLNIPIQRWLEIVEPQIGEAMCNNAGPFTQIYEGPPENCVEEVKKLFKSCARDEPAIELPDVFVSTPQYNWHWRLVTECVVAHYRGGLALEIFRSYQESNPPPPFNEIEDDQEAARQALLAGDPTLQLTFAGLPEIEDARAVNMIIKYSFLSRAWWVEIRCSLMDAESRKKFEENMAMATGLMRFSFAADYGQEDAKRYTETVQMWALHYTSANGHFGCGDMAWKVLDGALEESQKWADSWRSMRDPARRGA